jgi:glucans biosynthesis protein C
MIDQPAPSSSPRLYYLDALRVLAIFFVFLFHAVHPYDLNSWHVKNIDQSETLTIILVVFFMFGMPFFFMVAGAGTWFALRRRSAKQFAIERTRRLLVPFLFFTILSFFIAQYYEWGNRVYRGVTTLTFPEYLQATREWHSAFGFSPVWLSVGAHLWFLGFLYAFSILSLPLLMWFKSPQGGRFIAWLARICSVRGGILIFLLPLLALRYLLTPIFPQEHDWADFIYQGAFFVVGFLLFSHDAILKAIRRDGWLLGGIGLAAILSLMTVYLTGNPVDAWYEAYGTAGFYLTMGIFTLVGLVWSLALLFIGMRYMDKDKAWIRYAQEIALPFFIVHQPVILVIASFVVKWSVGIPLKMLVTVTSSFFICWGLVEFIIRRVGFLRFLFGMTSSRTDGRKESKVKPAALG